MDYTDAKTTGKQELEHWKCLPLWSQLSNFLNLNLTFQVLKSTRDKRLVPRSSQIGECSFEAPISLGCRILSVKAN